MPSPEFNLGWFLATRQLRRSSKGVTVLIVSILTLTFLNIVLVNGVLVGLAQGEARDYEKRYSGQLLVTPADTKEYVEDGGAVRKTAAGTPGVTGSAGRYVKSGTIVADYRERTKTSDKQNQIEALVAGIDPQQEDGLTGLSELIVKGKYLKEGDEGYLLVGAGLLAQYSDGTDPEVATIRNVDVGTRVKLKIGDVEKEMTVKWIVQSKVGNVNLRIYANGAELRKLIGRSEGDYNEIALGIPLPANPSAIQGLLRNNPHFRNVKIQTAPESQGQFLIDIENGFLALGAGIGAVALAVASITIFIVVYINALTRKRHIGILKGIGVEARAIQYAYVLQALFYAACGIAATLAITFGIVKPVIDRYPIPTPLSDGIFVTDFGSMASYALILFSVTAAAGYVPARLIVRKNTLDTILGR